MPKDSLEPIFEEIKLRLKRFEKGNLVSYKGGDKSKYGLYSKKEFEFMGRKMTEVCFASAMIQKNYVTFYYMPIYGSPEKISKKLKPELLKTLKGKSCFHIKTNDKELMTQIDEALEIGYEHFKTIGWL
jgi:hypothetical protein